MKILKMLNDYIETRKDVKELLGIMDKEKVIKVMKEYNNWVYGGADE
jgi:GTP-binding protein EngB required for normal cell division